MQVLIQVLALFEVLLEELLVAAVGEWVEGLVAVSPFPLLVHWPTTVVGDLGDQVRLPLLV